MPPLERQSRPTANRAASNVTATDTPKVLRGVVEADQDTIVVRGLNAFHVLRPAGFLPVFIGAGMGGWCLDRSRRGVDRLPDVLAVLQSAGFHLRVLVTGSASQAEPTRVGDAPSECATAADGTLW